jgi:CheY-like chemotaxis protein
VEDTGPGIAPEELERVFDPFVQAASRQQRSQEGTGLGLSISRQYVRLMGGDLSVCSEGLPGRGCLFKFDVPVTLADAVEMGAARPARRVLELAPNQPIYRLLVAEDEEANRQLLVKLLELLGFDVKEATNGQEAIEIWERWEPHLIWMDMRMPVLDGYEATKAIKSEIQNRKTGIQTVIIALTASAFEENRERVLVEGCDDFVRKPFREDEIYDVLAKHLGVRFLHEEIEGGDRDRRQVADDVLARDMAALPASWVADLQEATIRADLSRIITLVDQMREDNPALADALGGMVRNFEYKKILRLIEQGRG